MYKITGWKSGTASGMPSYSSVKPVLAGRSSLPIQEEDDLTAELEEAQDVAAPLPIERCTDVGGRLASQSSWNSDEPSNQKGKLLAKDKRKLREKRRSTGVAKFLAESINNMNMGHSDAETQRNTSINETPPEANASCNNLETRVDTSSIPMTPANSQSSATNDRYTQQDGRQASLDDGSSQSNSVVEEKTLRSSSEAFTVTIPGHDVNIMPAIKTPTSSVSGSGWRASTYRPCQPSESSLGGVIRPSDRVPGPSRSAMKPALPAKRAERWVGPSTQSPSVSPADFELARTLEEKRQLQNRLVALEKLLEEERKETASLRSLLSEKDQTIDELESEVNALNEDLDVADEEFSKLEEENRVLLRAMSELTAAQ